MRAGHLAAPRRLIATAVGSLAVLLLVATGAGVSVAVMAKALVVPPRRRPQNVRVLDVDRDRGLLTLEATPDTALAGRYGFWFSGDSGHAKLGDVVARSPGTVTRRILRVDRGDLELARRGRFSGWFHLTPEDLGTPFRDVVVSTPVGDAPAWFLPAAGRSTRWVIQVHGRAVTREECLRAVPVFHAAGYNCLLVSYRNDGVAPPAPDGRYALGDTEWQDVEAAISYAAAREATGIVLMGWSMGGAIALQAVIRAANRDLVIGVVLDSPVIDWTDVLAYHGALRGLPGPASAAALRTLDRPWGRVVTGRHAPIDFSRLDLVARSGELAVPVLVMHSDNDGFVPAAGSRRLARARPDIVTFVSFSPARHTRLWNYDPEGWNSAITSWLSAL